ncbi:uncharacterized protein CELE_C04A11.2 [Caenorhabditis elegans]|uniref:Uncharacterized protein n=1 Tax=Caenorhabditis elegans TaxID=6239 RepID=O17568_CAEEL|nr:Uncharacterized protein CELE_C04A11.2 [Caenorhabditis elegans]CAB03831.1 Uncharacterized protein CELE_C04A11.2 [Caenorhabditis elegans]|eukprot:NP_510289.1 Uncharacterized protein CELE_C04A11.2 [Caenorhabditis elegans]
MNPNDSMTLWSSYKTTEQRIGPLPSTSTPLKTPRSHRGPEEPNVTTIVVDTEQDENRNLCNSTQSLHISCRTCRELKLEVQELRKTVEKQAQYIQVLKKSLNSTSEMDSSESQHGNGSTASSVTKSSTRVQRVTPTKRDMASSGSTSTSSSTSTPVVRNILQQLTTPRSARTSTRAASGNRTPTGTPNMTRNVRPVTNRTSSSNVSPAAQVTPGTSSNHRSRLPPTIRVPQSEPIGTRSRPARYQSQTLPRQLTANNSRRSQSRRRLFVDEESNNEDRNEEQPEVNQYHRTRSEAAIEHLNISPMKDDQWARACPPRIHLERNRPEFIERVEARQSIIRAASEKRAEIEHRKRLAARAVASGQRSVESVSRELFADSTAVKAFYEEDMKEMTMKNIRKSQSYQNRIHQRIANVDRKANRIIAQTHSLRARSTSRSRYHQ